MLWSVDKCHKKVNLVYFDVLYMPSVQIQSHKRASYRASRDSLGDISYLDKHTYMYFDSFLHYSGTTWNSLTSNTSNEKLRPQAFQ